NSFERYAGIVNQNIVPALGAVLLNKLKPAQMSDAYTKALVEGRRDDKEGGLAPRTVGHMHRVLKQALSRAVRWELLTRNPVDAVDRVKMEWKPVETYELPQTADVVETFRGRTLFIPVLAGRTLWSASRRDMCPPMEER